MISAIFGAPQRQGWEVWGQSPRMWPGLVEGYPFLRHFEMVIFPVYLNPVVFFFIFAMWKKPQLIQLLALRFNALIFGLIFGLIFVWMDVWLNGCLVEWILDWVEWYLVDLMYGWYLVESILCWIDMCSMYIWLSWVIFSWIDIWFIKDQWQRITSAAPRCGDSRGVLGNSNKILYCWRGFCVFFLMCIPLTQAFIYPSNILHLSFFHSNFCGWRVLAARADGWSRNYNVIYVLMSMRAGWPSINLLVLCINGCMIGALSGGWHAWMTYTHTHTHTHTGGWRPGGWRGARRRGRGKGRAERRRKEVLTFTYYFTVGTVYVLYYPFYCKTPYIL
jgi:hypothetical protein